MAQAAKSRKTASRTLPKHLRVADTIRQRILKGVYPPGSRLPTETEFPRQVRAGYQTIVRALNHLVREGLIVRRRGDGTYVTEPGRAPLMPGRHLRLGVLWQQSFLLERLISSFQGVMTRGIVAALDLERVAPAIDRVGEKEPTRAVWSSLERGVTLEVVGESLYSRQRHPELKKVREGNYDGILTLSIIEPNFLEELLAQKVPLVVMDFPNESFADRADQVYVDAMPGYRAAVRAFARRGLRRIHFVGARGSVPAPSADMPPEDVLAFREGKSRIDPDSLLRASGFRAGMEEAGLEVGDEQIHFEIYGTEAELARRLLALPAGKRPEAFLCSDVDQAERMLQVCHEKGHPAAGAGASILPHEGPALPISIDGMEMGRTAAELMIWRLTRPARLPMRVGIPARFDPRGVAARGLPAAAAWANA